MPHQDVKPLDVSTEEFNILNLCGTRFYIDKPTRREIEHFVKHAEHPWDALTVSDLVGAEVLVIVDAVNGIWSSSPEQRDADRAIQAQLDKEEL